MQLTRLRAAALAAAPALLLGAAVAVPGVSAQNVPDTLTFHELDKGSTLTHIRNTRHAPRRSNLQGDVIVFTNRLVDDSGAQAGKLSVTCITTKGALDFMKSADVCTGVAEISGGTVTFQLLLKPSASRVEAAITGGTGAYAGARGTVVSETSDGDVRDTVTFIR